MKEFNEEQTTNLYLIEQLVLARKYNEVLEARVIELMADLRQSSQLLDACTAYMS